MKESFAERAILFKSRAVFSQLFESFNSNFFQSKMFVSSTLASNTMFEVLLIAALIFSAGYYSAPIFYNSKNLNCIGALSFYDSKRSIGEVLPFFKSILLE